MKPVLSCIRDYVLQFPALRDRCLYADYLGAEPAYTVEAVPCNPVYKRYTDGDTVKQFHFIFAGREFFNADVSQCTENSDFYDAFVAWAEEQNRAGNLPDLDGRKPLALQVLTGGYVFDCTPDTARYQVQLNLIYEE